MTGQAPYAAHPGGPHFALTLHQEAFGLEAREWARKEVAPHADAAAAGIFPAAVIRAAAERGYMGIVSPRSLGGLGLDHLCFALFVEEVSYVCASTAVALDVHASVGTEPLLWLGSEEQRRCFVPDLASGRVLAAFALTEPEAGSDAAGLRSTARREGDDYVLDGGKTFISNAGKAGLYTVLASTDREQGARGITAFLVPAATAGLTIGRPMHKMGLKGSVTAEIVLNQCRVPAANRLGAEGEGFKVAMRALDSGRIGISAQALGIGRAVLDETMRILAHHDRAGGRIPQATQFALADLATSMEAARALTWEAARLCDSGLPFTKLASMAKLLATDGLMAGATSALDLVADLATPGETHRLERYFLDARATQLYEGTNQIQRLVIARHTLGG
ncbi:MAG TPA: acyl-CoA dehydrogenase family protein [Chloroflexota bacterium]|nr:acyl-CoA dehydrogenase family protein [Chloroflexota bacterium]